MAYAPHAIKTRQRNRVVDPIGLIGGPASWQSTKMCRDVFGPVGMAACEQLRVLVCDGADLLAWFGTVHDGRLSGRHARMFAAIAPALHKRFTLERLLDTASLGIAMLETTLAGIGAPAFVLGTVNHLHATNVAGRALYDRHRVEVRAALSGNATRFRFERTQLTVRGSRSFWLVVLHDDERRLTDAVATAARRWTLSARQREVLAHLVRGHANGRIAAELGVSVRAVELHVTRLLDRAGVDGRAALVAAVLLSPGAPT